MSAELKTIDFTETLCEIVIDNIEFRATRHAIEEHACILWIRDKRLGKKFEALGKFSRFDKRDILFFTARYTTSEELRELIEVRRFEKRISGLAPAFFQNLAAMSNEEKLKMYRDLYNLDNVIYRNDIKKKYRIMARKFHPDTGGDQISMSVINEAYQYLSKQAVD